MNISSSISQVIYQTQLPGKIMLNKAYLWPEYNAGNITRIAPINEKQEQTFNYIKRSSLELNNDNINNKITKIDQYSSNGSIIKVPNDYTPGSIFEALA
jgi:hypothetical protein